MSPPVKPATDAPSHGPHDPAATDDLVGALTAALALKALPRAGWVRAGVQSPESVAAHSWGIAWLVLTLCPPAVDRGRALALAAIHDLPEVVAGDITPHDGVSKQSKRDLEVAGLTQVLQGVPHAQELAELWHEYDGGETPEARFVKACDKLDMALQATVYQRETGMPTEEFVRSALGKLEAEQGELWIPLKRWLTDWLGRAQVR